MNKHWMIVSNMIDIFFIVSFVGIHLTYAIFMNADEVQWFITLNNMKQVIFLDTWFTIAIILEFISTIIKLEVLFDAD